MSYVVVAQFRVVEGKESDFEQLLIRHAERSREEEEGCFVFDVCRDVKQPGLFLLYEVYRDEAAYAAHRANSRHAAVIEAIKPLVMERCGSLFWSRQVFTKLVQT